MAEEYLKVLRAFGCDVTVIGRDGVRAVAFAKKYGAIGRGGGVDAISDIDMAKVDLVIVSCAVEALAEVSCACLKAGTKRLLIEKPGSLDIRGLRKIRKMIRRGGKVAIAYNRRYYNSVAALKERLEKEGGPLGCFFDFTERERDVHNCKKAPAVVARWGLANSTHVIDTALYLIGKPEKMFGYRSGAWQMHTSGTSFTGSGRTQKCLFSYFATWAGGGRWNIEISTREGRYKLSPLEELHFCRKNQFAWENVALADDDDNRFKPGLYKMVKKILAEDDFSGLPNIEDQISLFGIANRIFGYGR